MKEAAAIPANPLPITITFLDDDICL